MKFVLFIFLTSLAYHASAISRLHVCPSERPGSVLKAISIISARELLQLQHKPAAAPSELLMEYTIEMNNHILLFDDLEYDNVTISSCSPSSVTSGSFVLAMQGAKLDPSDFRRNAVFIINVGDMQKHCGPVQRLDELDDALFFTIEQTVSTKHSVVVHLSIIRGENVIPAVHFLFVPKPTSLTSLPCNVVYSDTPEFAHIWSSLSPSFTARTLNETQSLSTVQRLSLTLQDRATLFHGALLEYKITLDTDAQALKLRRAPLRLEWEQSMDAHINLALSVAKQVSSSAHGELAQGGIGPFAICRKILGFRLCAGPFWKLDWLIDGHIGVTDIKIDVEAGHVSKQLMSMSLQSGLEATSLLAHSSHRSRLHVHIPSSTDAAHGIHMFAGVRLGLGIGGTFGSIKSEANVGAKLGIEASAKVQRSPPHSPFTGGGFHLGVCDQCHILRGDAKICGKDMSMQYVCHGRSSENVLVPRLFDACLTTICAIPAAC